MLAHGDLEEDVLEGHLHGLEHEDVPPVLARDAVDVAAHVTAGLGLHLIFPDPRLALHVRADILEPLDAADGLQDRGLLALDAGDDAVVGRDLVREVGGGVVGECDCRLLFGV